MSFLIAFGMAIVVHYAASPLVMALSVIAK